jgi:hypothetical protein
MSIMILFLGLTVLCIISTTLQIYICLAGDHDDTEPCGQFSTSENFLDDQAASTQVEGSFPNHTWWQNGSSRGRYNAETVVYRTASVSRGCMDSVWFGTDESSADESREALCGELESFQTRYRKGLEKALIVVTDQCPNFSLPLQSSSPTIGHTLRVILPFKW